MKEIRDRKLLNSVIMFNQLLTVKQPAAQQLLTLSKEGTSIRQFIAE